MLVCDDVWISTGQRGNAAIYTVGECDILILSAEESDGLIAWLKENDYRIPDGAESVVRS